MSSGDFVHNLVLRAAGIGNLTVRPTFIPYFAPGRGPDHRMRGNRMAGDLPRSQPPRTNAAQEPSAGAAGENGESGETPSPTTDSISEKSDPGSPGVRRTFFFEEMRPDVRGPSGAGLVRAEGEMTEMDDAAKIGAKAGEDKGPSRAASSGLQFADRAKGKVVSAKKSTVVHGIDGSSDLSGRFSSDNNSNANDTIDRNTINDAAILETGQSRALLGDDKQESPSPLKILPTVQDLQRGKRELDRSRFWIDLRF